MEKKEFKGEYSEIDRIIKENYPQFKRVLEIGTGTANSWCGRCHVPLCEYYAYEKKGQQEPDGTIFICGYCGSHFYKPLCEL